ncbi:hypothetical protein Cgig2_001014 [Carnegiea gigantea]|uniref:FAR1 domain-containing protein n=1 Tax=Carnegiea gigantea TaxID=171969 RepID=A0A9Q1Q636_9CARY|nr:hypothetical protein Cgig2_001014 [Carnegiea gigantea]
MRFKNIEDALAFYKRYANCVGFSVRKSSTTKNKSGKIWKVFVCSKQRYREPRKTLPQSAVALANVISRVRENVEEKRVKRRRVETREGCNARMVVSSTNDGQFEVYNALCSAIGATLSLASDVPTPFYPPFLQNLVCGLHKMDMRNKDEVIMRMTCVVAVAVVGRRVRSRRKWMRVVGLLKELEQACQTPLSRLRQVVDAMAVEMHASLVSEGGSKLKMLLTYGIGIPKEEQDKVVKFDFHGQPAELKHSSVLSQAEQIHQTPMSCWVLVWLLRKLVS